MPFRCHALKEEEEDIRTKNSSSSELSVTTNHVGCPLFDCQILGRVVVVVVTMVFLTIL
jgi:hypothetical protein